MNEANRSELLFDVVCIATMPGLTLLLGAIGVALLHLAYFNPLEEPSK